MTQQTTVAAFGKLEARWAWATHLANTNLEIENPEKEPKWN